MGRRIPTLTITREIKKPKKKKKGREGKKGEGKKKGKRGKIKEKTKRSTWVQKKRAVLGGGKGKKKRSP